MGCPIGQHITRSLLWGVLYDKYAPPPSLTFDEVDGVYVEESCHHGDEPNGGAHAVDSVMDVLHVHSL